MLLVERQLRTAGRLLCVAGGLLGREHAATRRLDNADARQMLDQAQTILQEVRDQLPPLAPGMEVRELPCA